MAKINEETLQAVEDCGAAEMPLEETFEIAEITQEEWDENETIRKRYRKGQLKSKLQVRQAVVKMATQGAPAMVKLYLAFNGDGEQPQTDIDEEMDNL